MGMGSQWKKVAITCGRTSYCIESINFDSDRSTVQVLPGYLELQSLLRKEERREGGRE